MSRGLFHYYIYLWFHVISLYICCLLLDSKTILEDIFCFYKLENNGSKQARYTITIWHVNDLTRSQILRQKCLNYVCLLSANLLHTPKHFSTLITLLLNRTNCWNTMSVGYTSSYHSIYNQIIFQVLDKTFLGFVTIFIFALTYDMYFEQ